MRTRSFVLAGAMALAWAAPAGCGSTDDAALFEVRASSAEGTGAVRPLDVDAARPVEPGAGWHLWVVVTEVRVRVEPGLGGPGGKSEEADEESKQGKGEAKADEKQAGKHEGADEGDHWIVLSRGQTRLDLFDPTSTETILGALPAPAGRLTQVRLVLAADPLLETASGSLVLRCPSCATSGIKLIVEDKPFVAAGEKIRIVLVFDRSHVLWQDAHGMMVSPAVKVKAIVVR